jgi:2-C-methyl-D-erythritol 2,4-cyclodiphosphate synthase
MRFSERQGWATSAGISQAMIPSGRTPPAKVVAVGFGVGNVDVTVILEVPRLAAYREEMIASLAAAMAIPADGVSLKAKSNDGLGPVGAGEAIAAVAIALVHRRLSPQG